MLMNFPLLMIVSKNIIVTSKSLKVMKLKDSLNSWPGKNMSRSKEIKKEG